MHRSELLELEQVISLEDSLPVSVCFITYPLKVLSIFMSLNLIGVLLPHPHSIEIMLLHPQILLDVIVVFANETRCGEWPTWSAAAAHPLVDDCLLCFHLQT